MKRFWVVLCGFFLCGLVTQAQIERQTPDDRRYTTVGLNIASLVVGQLQLEVEVGNSNRYLAFVGGVFYGQTPEFTTMRNEILFKQAEQIGAGAGLRIYENITNPTRFFVQPSLYYKQIAVTREVMQFISTTYDGLPAQRWGAADVIDRHQGLVAEMLLGSQSFIGPILLEAGVGFVYRNMNLVSTNRSINYTPGAELVLGLGEFNPLAFIKLGYKF